MRKLGEIMKDFKDTETTFFCWHMIKVLEAMVEPEEIETK